MPDPSIPTELNAFQDGSAYKMNFIRLRRRPRVYPWVNAIGNATADVASHNWRVFHGGTTPACRNALRRAGTGLPVGLHLLLLEILHCRTRFKNHEFRKKARKIAYYFDSCLSACRLPAGRQGRQVFMSTSDNISGMELGDE